MGPLGTLWSGRTLWASWHSRFVIELYFALLPSADRKMVRFEGWWGGAPGGEMGSAGPRGWRPAAGHETAG